MQDGDRITLTSFGWDYLGCGNTEDCVRDSNDSTGYIPFNNEDRFTICFDL